MGVSNEKRCKNKTWRFIFKQFFVAHSTSVLQTTLRQLAKPTAKQFSDKHS